MSHSPSQSQSQASVQIQSTSTFHVLHSRQSLTKLAHSRANLSSHAAKMGSCEHGSSLKRVLQSRLGLRGLGRRRRRRIALSRTSYLPAERANASDSVVYLGVWWVKNSDLNRSFFFPYIEIRRMS